MLTTTPSEAMTNITAQHVSIQRMLDAVQRTTQTTGGRKSSTMGSEETMQGMARVDMLYSNVGRIR